MIRVLAFWTWIAFLTPSLAFAITLDFPEGPLSLPNAPKLAALGGDAVSLRLNARGEVAVRRGETEQVLADPRSARGRISLPVLYVDPSGVHAFWRLKLANRVEGLGKAGDKMIYVRSSSDGGKAFGPPHRLNQEGGAFQPRVVGNGRGAVYAAWVDERAGRYHVFLNHSTDAGKTWKGKDTQADIAPSGGAYDPTLVAEGERVWLAWVEGGAQEDVKTEEGSPKEARKKRTRSDGFAVLLRRSSDRGETWADPVRVVDLTAQPSSLVLIRAKGGLLLYWFTEKGIAGAKSDDDGRTWTAMSGLPEGQDVSGLTAAVDPSSGRVILAYTVTPDGKNAALFATSSADGVKFDAPVHLASKTPHLTSAILPEIVIGRSGTVMVVWQDFRYIRATPCARLSRDGGRSWLAQDFCLEEQPGKFHGFFPRGAADGKGGLHALWVRYADDRMQKTEVVLTRVEPARPPAGSVAEPTRTRLEERVAEFWKSRIAAEWGKSYDLMDPVFRSRVRQAAYIGTQGVVKYYEFKIEEVNLTERVARVRVLYTMEIPELDLEGKRHSVPKRDEQTVQEWVWMDGDWYLVFKDLMNQAFFRY